MTPKSIYGKVTMEKAIPINYGGPPPPAPPPPPPPPPAATSGSTADKSKQQRLLVSPGIYVAPQPPQMAIHKKTNKKKEPRRHTLQNGIDQNAVKKLRQLEAERDMLYQGLDVVEKAKMWYKQQLQGISEKMHYLPFCSNKPVRFKFNLIGRCLKLLYFVGCIVAKLLMFSHEGVA